MARKKKEPMQAHGAVMEQKSVFAKLAENKYGTTDTAIYTKQLESMSLADLQFHAINVAHLRPGYDKGRLITSLVRAFESYIFGQVVKTR